MSTLNERIEEFLACGPATATQIAAALRLTRPVVTGTISNLMKKNAIRKIGKEPSEVRCGRPNVIYAVSEPAEHFTVPPRADRCQRIGKPQPA